MQMPRIGSYVLVLTVLVGLVGAGQLPLPPRQTSVQAEAWQRAHELAQNASEAAVPVLLSVIDSEEFRKEIAELPIANANSTEILNLLRTMVRSALQFHNFPALNFALATSLDPTLPQMATTNFLPNYYTAALYEGFLNYNLSLVFLENYAETELYGFPPFQNVSRPTLDEALARPQYSCLNLYNFAGGCILYGDISFALSRSWVNNLTLLSAVDTGIYSSCCRVTNNTEHRAVYCGSPSGPVNCSAYDGTLGTMDYFDHLLLANANFWNVSLSSVLSRHFNPDGPLTAQTIYAALLGYFEGAIAGSIPFPEGVLHLEAGVAQVFGTNNTAVARSWAANSSWPILWSSGFAIPRSLSDPSYLFSVNVNDLILDPFLVQFTNITIDAESLATSQQVFTEAQDFAQLYLASDPSNAPHDSTYWAKVYGLLLNGVDPRLHVRLPGIEQNECEADLDHCFAVQVVTGQCVCTN